MPAPRHSFLTLSFFLGGGGKGRKVGIVNLLSSIYSRFKFSNFLFFERRQIDKLEVAWKVVTVYRMVDLRQKINKIGRMKDPIQKGKILERVTDPRIERI